MKILWANRYCLFDTSSGASISAREILLELARLGHDVTVLGATVFDSPAGSALINNAIAKHDVSQKKTITIQDDGFKHHLVVTKSTSAGLMSLDELNFLYAHYRKLLAEFKPDVVLFYGGNSFDMLLPVEAKKHGALTAAYLVNANYVGERWSEDVDLIFTDSRATAKFYKDKVGLEVIPIGTIIDPNRVVADKRAPNRITFINPSLEKGAALVVQLADHLDKKRPELTFEVVESRGSWQKLAASILGPDRILKNVIISPNTNNMANVYSQSRILLAPSLWWESGARVLAEAALNGIPQIVTDHGGSPEMVAEGGIVVRLPKEMHEAPYNKLLSQALVENVSRIIEHLFDDESRYQALSEGAKRVAARQHNQSANIRVLEATLRASVCIKKPLLPGTSQVSQRVASASSKALSASPAAKKNHQASRGMFTDVSEQQLFSRKLPQNYALAINGQTMVSHDRLESLYGLCEEVYSKGLSGDFVECGVYRGGCAMIMAWSISRNPDDTRMLWLYDTFAGMTEPDESDVRLADGLSAKNKYIEGQRSGHNEWCYGPKDIVLANLKNTGVRLEKLKLVEGKVEETLTRENLPSSISILRLDTDWYASTRVELERLYDRVVHGGFIIIDDYFYWDGCRKAVDEFFERSRCSIQVWRVGISLVIMKL